MIFALWTHGVHAATAYFGVGNEIVVLDTNTNTEITRIPAAGFDIVLTPDATRLYVALVTNDLAIIDTATNSVSATVPLPCAPLRLVMTPNGQRLYVSVACDVGTGLPDFRLLAIDTASNAVVGDVPSIAAGPLAARTAHAYTLCIVQVVALLQSSTQLATP